jgi:acetoin:2,6-dichlorophenolindophenol oxidoreductase subunit beta
MKQTVYLKAINEALREEMQRDEKVFIIGENVQQGTFGETANLVQIFGADRVMDTPLAETAITGAAVGCAMAGFRPVADMEFGDFMYVAGDEILLKAAKWHFMHGGKVNVPVVFMAAIGGGMKLGSEHSMCPEALIMHTPGLKLAVPSTPYDAKGLLKTAIRDNNPVVFLYNKGLLGLPGEIPDDEYLIPFGKADIKRAGTDVTVVAISRMVHLAMAVADKIKNDISVEIIDPRTLEPLDMETILESVKKTGRVIVVDEDNKRCGPSAEIAAQIMENAFDFLDAPVQRVAGADSPIAAGVLEDLVLPQPKDIEDAIKAVMM